MVRCPRSRSREGLCSASAWCCYMQWEGSSQPTLLNMEKRILLFLQLPGCGLLQLWGSAKKKKIKTPANSQCTHGSELLSAASAGASTHTVCPAALFKLSLGVLCKGVGGVVWVGSLGCGLSPASFPGCSLGVYPGPGAPRCCGWSCCWRVVSALSLLRYGGTVPVGEATACAGGSLSHFMV